MPKRKTEEKEKVSATDKVKEVVEDEIALNNKKIEDENDLSDSDESVYSGLEEEEGDEEESELEWEGEDSDENKEDESSDGDDAEEEDEAKTTGDVEGDVDDADDENDSEDEGESDEEELSVKVATTNPAIPVTNGEEPREEMLDRIATTKAIFEDIDTSDEEDIRNTVGNIPMEWYDEYQHIGYDLAGKKIGKKKHGDQLDGLLSKMEDPDYWRTVYDKLNDEDIKLTEEDIGIIRRIRGGMYPEKGTDPYEPYVTAFTDEVMELPLKTNPQPKNSFIPSKWEHKKVIKIVRAIRNGWIKPKVPKDKPKYFLLWGKDDKANNHKMHWPAPKLKLPGHEESYNPPPEYLPTEEEIAAWEAMDPEDRPQNFLAKKYDSLRKVPGYANFIQEKFERCLDLYLCPRQRKIRLQVNPEDLIPKLPRPRDLQPYPTTQHLIYNGHEDVVTCISVDPTGQWLASGSSDKTIRFWEVSTCRCLKKITVDGPVHSLQWNPLEDIPILAAAVEKELLIINPDLGDKLLSKHVDTQIDAFVAEGGEENELVKWNTVSDVPKLKDGIRLVIQHDKSIKQVTWHRKGDYLATVMPDGESKSVIVHQFTKRKSQCPFKKAKGQIQCVCFHPNKPFFFVATQRYVRVYNLQKQELSKKLLSGVKWISSMDVHPQGDNIIIGSFDKRLCWFDMDLSSKPYKILRHHKKAVRQVAHHRAYPLFASAADDGSVIVCHGAVYNDLMQNPMIVPLKILRGHKVVNDLGVLDCKFHPHQPWVFTAGADKTIRLFT